MIYKHFISFVALAATVPLSQVVPATAATLDVFAPQWTEPKAGDKWKRGHTYHARWETDNAPRQITNPIGRILFVKDGKIDLDRVLADNFNISAGEVEIKVPTYIPPGECQLVLFGDSGDLSPVFSIV